MDWRPNHHIFKTPAQREVYRRNPKDMDTVIRHAEEDPAAFLKNVLMAAVILELDETHYYRYQPKQVLEGISSTIDIIGSQSFLDSLVK